MATISERARAVWWYAETKSVIQVQRKFCHEYNKNLLTFKTIKKWCNNFFVLKGHGGGNPGIQEEAIENQTSSKRTWTETANNTQNSLATITDTDFAGNQPQGISFSSLIITLQNKSYFFTNVATSFPSLFKHLCRCNTNFKILTA